MDTAEIIKIAEAFSDEVLSDFQQGIVNRDRLSARVVALLMKYVKD